MNGGNSRNRIVGEIRKAIAEQLRGEDLNIYALTKRLKNRVQTRTIYDFMAAKAEINIVALAEILDALDLQITVKPNHYSGYQLKAKWLGAEDATLRKLYVAFVPRNRNAMKMMNAKLTKQGRKIIPLPSYPQSK